MNDTTPATGKSNDTTGARTAPEPPMPGPWRVHKNGGPDFCILTDSTCVAHGVQKDANTRLIVAACNAALTVSPEDPIGAAERWPKEREDLLAALRSAQTVLGHCSCREYPHDVRTAVDAAIARAEKREKGGGE